MKKVGVELTPSWRPSAISALTSSSVDWYCASKSVTCADVARRLAHRRRRHRRLMRVQPLFQRLGPCSARRQPNGDGGLAGRRVEHRRHIRVALGSSGKSFITSLTAPGLRGLVLREDRLVVHVRLRAGRALVVVELHDEHLRASVGTMSGTRGCGAVPTVRTRVLLVLRSAGVRRPRPRPPAAGTRLPREERQRRSRPRREQHRQRDGERAGRRSAWRSASSTTRK